MLDDCQGEREDNGQVKRQSSDSREDNVMDPRVCIILACIARDILSPEQGGTRIPCIRALSENYRVIQPSLFCHATGIRTERV